MALVGAHNPKHVKQNVKAIGVRLSATELLLIDDELAKLQVGQ